MNLHHLHLPKVFLVLLPGMLETIVSCGGPDPAPAAIVVGKPRHYGAVPAIGEHSDRVILSPQRTKS